MVAGVSIGGGLEWIPSFNQFMQAVISEISSLPGCERVHFSSSLHYPQTAASNHDDMHRGWKDIGVGG